MSQTGRGLRTTVVLALVALAATACSDGEGPTALGDAGTAAFGIVMEAAPSGATSVRDASSGSVATMDAEPARATLAPDKVDHIHLPIGRVEAKQDDGPWMDAGTVDATVDLLNLPDEGLEILDSSLPVGEYEKLRFFLTGQPTIVLNSAFQVGQHTFEAGEHPLRIPSSQENGLRLRAEFEVDADGETLTIVFDGREALRKVVATGSGMLMISPELKVRNEDGDDVGEMDDEFEVEGPVTGADPDAGTFTVERGGDEVTVAVDDDTEFEGAFATLEDVAAALDAGEPVVAEVEGTVQDDGSLLADEVEFELED